MALSRRRTMNQADDVTEEGGSRRHVSGAVAVEPPELG